MIVHSSLEQILVFMFCTLSTDWHGVMKCFLNLFSSKYKLSHGFLMLTATQAADPMPADSKKYNFTLCESSVIHYTYIILTLHTLHLRWTYTVSYITLAPQVYHQTLSLQRMAINFFVPCRHWTYQLIDIKSNSFHSNLQFTPIFISPSMQSRRAGWLCASRWSQRV